MFCKDCGAGLTGVETVCPVCGKKLKDASEIKSEEEVKAIQNNDIFAVPTTTHADIKPSVPFSERIAPVVNFVKKHKTIFIVVCSIILVAVIGLILFNSFYDFTKLSWDDENGDYKVQFTGPTTVTLMAKAFDKENNRLNDIKFEVSGGDVTVDGYTAKWKLPNTEGEYTITAIAPSGKKINKSIKVYVLNESNNLFGVSEDEETDETDSDGDGITNKKEREIGTNPFLIDTDYDGLPDPVEIDNSKTDPIKSDTDDDGINDGNELDLGLDPLKKDSKDDGINDGDRELTYTVNEEKLGVSIKINGKGNVASTGVDILKNSTFDSMDGVLDKVYNFYTNGTINSAEVRIKYNLEEITKKELNEDDLTLYYFNEDTKKLEKIDTTVDKDNKELVVTLNHFSKYVIGDNTTVLDDYTSDILFVIDNSVSMYTEKQMSAAGYTSSTGAVGNDSEFKRVSLTKDVIDKFTGNYRFGLSEFAGNYKELNEFTNDRDSIKNKVDSIMANWQVSLTGTNIVSALKDGIKEFENDKNGHYIILMTDGKNTEGRLSYSKKDIISSAKENNIKICVIGLGKDLDNDDLKSIATETGCTYNSVSNASGLDQIYEIVGSNINYNLVDTDADGQTDGTILADSGFITKRDGFNFDNYGSVQSDGGNCYGMAFFASLFYQQKLPTNKGSKHLAKLGIIQPYDSNGYDLSGTYFKDQTKNLYDYQSSNETMKLLQDTELPADYRDRIENRVWKINDTYKTMFNELGFTIVEKSVKGHDDFDKYESVLIDVNSEDFKSKAKEDYQLYNAIWYLFIHQNQMKYTSFASSPDKAYDEIINNVKTLIPQPVNIGSHEINVLRIIQDNSDSNKFKLEVYDNNYSGDTRYVYVTRSKFSQWAFGITAWTNDYQYSFKYDKDNDGTLDDIKMDLSYIELE